MIKDFLILSFAIIYFGWPILLSLLVGIVSEVVMQTITLTTCSNSLKIKYQDKPILKKVVIPMVVTKILLVILGFGLSVFLRDLQNPFFSDTSLVLAGGIICFLLYWNLAKHFLKVKNNLIIIPIIFSSVIGIVSFFTLGMITFFFLNYLISMGIVPFPSFPGPA